MLKEKEKKLVNICLILASVIFLSSLAGKLVVFGSKPGNWVYGYFSGITIEPFIYAIFILPVAYLGLVATHKHIEKREWEVVLFWMIAGLAFQLLAVSLRPFTLSEIIKCPVACSHYSATLKFTPGQFLENYQFIATTGRLPLHAASNMPGKVLFFYLLKTLTSSARGMGFIIVFLSTLGGLFVYQVAKRLFSDRLIAAYSMILYFCIPAKVYSFPLLNTVTPLFVMLIFCLFFEYLVNKRVTLLLLLGLALYWLVIFEPLPVITFLVLVFFLVKNIYEGKVNIRDIANIIIIPLVVFLAIYFALKIIFGLDIFKLFLFINREMAQSHINLGRAYSVWVFENLRNFFFTLGIAPAVLFLLYIVKFLEGIFKGEGKSLLSSGGLLLVSFSLVLLILDSSGVIRAEVARNWIFLMVFVQMIASYFSVKYMNRLTIYILVTASILQALIGMSMVGFVMPFFR